MADEKRRLLDLLPNQGCWSDEEYLCLTDHTKRLVELTDGCIELLPAPTDLHQSITGVLFIAFSAFLTPMNGKAHLAPLRMRIRRGKFREPDVLLVKDAKDKRRRNRYWTGADLTLEVVSEEKPERDLVDKRHDYAEANVPEYWIANPQTETVTVLRLENGAYVEHGIYGRGQRAESIILPGFSVAVDDVFNIDCPPDNGNDGDQ